RTTARTVSLTVRDDGIGIAAGAASAARAARRRTGQGIVGMQERARLLGGSVTVERATPTGTLVTAKIPLGERRV
ncbi:MAG: ATP-binding protein, partial [Vulcanimicrobiaceae bacterium]